MMWKTSTVIGSSGMKQEKSMFQQLNLPLKIPGNHHSSRLPRELEKGRKETNKMLQPQQILALHDMRIPTTWLWSDV